VSIILSYQNLRITFFYWLYSPRGSWSLFQFYDHFTDGRTPWASDQLVARPLTTNRTTQTQNKHIHTQNIHALCGIRIHDPGFRASEDNSCLRPRVYCDRLRITLARSNAPNRVIFIISLVDKRSGSFRNSILTKETEDGKSPAHIAI
jgi:hypothetical protein